MTKQRDAKEIEAPSTMKAQTDAPLQKTLEAEQILMDDDTGRTVDPLAGDDESSIDVEEDDPIRAPRQKKERDQENR